MHAHNFCDFVAAYTDTAGTRADADDSDIFIGVLAARASKKLKASDDFNLIPTVKLGVTYDFAETSYSATVGLANGSAYIVGSSLRVLISPGYSLEKKGFCLTTRPFLFIKRASLNSPLGGQALNVGCLFNPSSPKSYLPTSEKEGGRTDLPLIL